MKRLMGLLRDLSVWRVGLKLEKVWSRDDGGVLRSEGPGTFYWIQKVVAPIIHSEFDRTCLTWSTWHWIANSLLVLCSCVSIYILLIEFFFFLVFQSFDS